MSTSLLHRAAALACTLLLAASLPAQSPGARPLDLATYPRTELTVSATGAQPGQHHFHVWVADTAARAEQGLMFVSDLPENQGMVFPLETPRIETMWMKNTYIELDLLFIRPDGRIVKIIQRAAPLSLSTLSSEVPVAAVLELRGGTAGKLGLKVGDRVSWKKPPA